MSQVNNVGQNKKRVLETIRKAAYFPKRLNQISVEETNVPLCVDTIKDQVSVVTYRVLGFLLLGIVKIYSEKVKYTCNYCDTVLSKLNEFGGSKKATMYKEAIPIPSITRPPSFRLDAFDLMISEETMSAHIRPSQQLVLEDTRKDAGYSYHSSHKMYTHNDDMDFMTFSGVFTPFQDFLSLQFQESEIITGQSFRASDGSIENLRGNNKSVPDETMDPTRLGEVQGQDNEEQIRVSDVIEYAEVDKGPSSFGAYDNGQEIDTMEKTMLPVMLSPESTANHRASVTFDETPQFKDPSGSGIFTPDFMDFQTPAANNQEMDTVEKMVSPTSTTDHRASVTFSETPRFKNQNNSGTPTPDFMAFKTPAANNHEMDTVEKMVSPANTTDHRASVTFNETSRFKGRNDSGTHTLDFMAFQTPAANDQEMDTVEKMVSPISTTDHETLVTFNETLQFKDRNDSGTLTPNSMAVQTPAANIQKKDTVEKTMLPKMVSPASMTNHQASVTCNETPQANDLSDLDTLAPDFMAVQTPAGRECRGVLRKRKCLFDDILVLPSSVMKKNLANPSDLFRPRKLVPNSALYVWKIWKMASLPHNLLEPLIPCSSRLLSVNTIENIKKVQVVEALKVPENLTVLESPSIHRSPEQTNVQDSAIFHQYPDQTPDILVAPINPQSPQPTDIAPSTPITTFSSSSLLHDGPRRTLSSDSLEEDCNDNNEIGISEIVEDISSSAGETWEMNKWSARTRTTARSLCKNFSSQKQGKEEEKASIFKILEGKKKRESALLFYEILVLKSGSYVDVEQQAPYDDIVVSGTSKLKKFCDL